MAYCRFCGKELVNGQCDCDEFLASVGKKKESHRQEEAHTYAGQGASEQKRYREEQRYTGRQYKEQRYEEPHQEEQHYEEAYHRTRDPFFVQSVGIDFSSPSSFVTSIRDQSGVSDPAASTGDPYEHNVPIVPDCVEAEDNEVIVKQYNLAMLRTRLKFMKAEGRLMVTNRRVLFRAAGTSLTGNILQEHQFNLDEIGGIEIHKDYKFSILSFLGCLILSGFAFVLPEYLFATTGDTLTMILGLIFGLACMVPTFVVYKHFWIKLFFAMAGSGCLLLAYTLSDSNILFGILALLGTLLLIIDLMIVCFVPNLVVKVKTKGAQGAVVIGSQKSMFSRKTGDDYSGFAEVMPWEDTVMAMNELGTMIDDLQKQGDYAIEKWSK